MVHCVHPYMMFLKEKLKFIEYRIATTYINTYIFYIYIYYFIFIERLFSHRPNSIRYESNFC